MKAPPTLRGIAPHFKTLVPAIALACTVGTATAASSTSSVSISSFSYTASGGALSWSEPFQSFQATALNAGGLLGADQDSFDALDWLPAIVGADTSQAHAAVSTTTERRFFASASTTSSVGTATNPPNKAEAIAGQSGSFALSSPGSVTFNVGYVLGAASPGGNALSDHATALLSFGAFNGDGSSGGNVGAQLMSFSQASGIASRSGTLTLTVNLAANETGFYNLQGSALAFSVAAVPEPSEWALMTVGLFGVVACARRRERATARDANPLDRAMR